MEIAAEVVVKCLFELSPFVEYRAGGKCHELIYKDDKRNKPDEECHLMTIPVRV